jgi:hypothetical protein
MSSINRIVVGKNVQALQRKTYTGPDEYLQCLKELWEAFKDIEHIFDNEEKMPDDPHKEGVIVTIAKIRDAIFELYEAEDNDDTEWAERELNTLVALAFFIDREVYKVEINQRINNVQLPGRVLFHQTAHSARKYIQDCMTEFEDTQDNKDRYIIRLSRLTEGNAKEYDELVSEELETYEEVTLKDGDFAWDITYIDTDWAAGHEPLAIAGIENKM